MEERTMSEYDRATRDCPVSLLHPELRQAVQAYFDQHNLGDPAEAVQACCETSSVKKSASRLASWLNDRADQTIHTGILLTPERLIWARLGDQTGIHLVSANLREILVKVYHSRLTQDTGLEVSGYVEGVRNKVKGYLGMESEEIARRFYDHIRQATDLVKPPPKRKSIFGFWRE